MEEDSNYFMKLSHIEHYNTQNGNGTLIDISNAAVKKVSAYDFWSQVSFENIERLQEPFAYKYDFELFGYSPDKYIKELGLLTNT